MKIISIEKVVDILAVFIRFLMTATLIEKEAKFAHEYHLGYINSCQTNFYTALRASIYISLPLQEKNRVMFDCIADRYCFKKMID